MQINIQQSLAAFAEECNRLRCSAEDYPYSTLAPLGHPAEVSAVLFFSRAQSVPGPDGAKTSSHNISGQIGSLPVEQLATQILKDIQQSVFMVGIEPQCVVQDDANARPLQRLLDIITRCRSRATFITWQAPVNTGDLPAGAHPYTNVATSRRQAVGLERHPLQPPASSPPVPLPRFTPPSPLAPVRLTYSVDHVVLFWQPPTTFSQ